MSHALFLLQALVLLVPGLKERKLKHLKPNHLVACLLLWVPAASFAFECGDLSPTVLDDISLHEEHIQTQLTAGQVRAASQLLRRFDGNWQGNGIGVMCLGEGNNSRERVRHYEIEADGTGKRDRGEINAELEHDRGTLIERLRLVLNGSQLGTSNSSSSLVQVLSIGPDQVEWLYRFKGNEGRSPFESRWRVRFSNTRGRQGHQATVEHWLYGQGGLASMASWSINNR